MASHISEPPTHLFPDFESKWQALIARDPRAAKCFLYCVKSTGIFCRPTCAARLARRKNVVFYDTIPEAEQAGFRPCKRCKPMLPLHETHHSIIRQTCKLLDGSPKVAPQLKVLAENAGLTQWHFHRIFRRFTGITPKMYWEARHSPNKQVRKKLKNIDMETLIAKIAQLDENTVIDHELIKQKYLKPKKELDEPLQKKLPTPPQLPIIPLSIPPLPHSLPQSLSQPLPQPESLPPSYPPSLQSSVSPLPQPHPQQQQIPAYDATLLDFGAYFPEIPLMVDMPPPDAFAGFGLFDMDHDNYIVPAAAANVSVSVNINSAADKIEYTLPQEQDLRLLMLGELC